jgi:hypothetical protein
MVRRGECEVLSASWCGGSMSNRRLGTEDASVLSGPNNIKRGRQQTFTVVHKNTTTRLADRGKDVPLIPLRPNPLFL